MIVISKHLFIQYTAETMSLDEKCPMTRQAEDKSYFSKRDKKHKHKRKCAKHQECTKIQRNLRAQRRREREAKLGMSYESHDFVIIT